MSVDETKVIFLISKWQEEKILLKILNVHTDRDQQWVIQDGVIWIKFVPCWSCMICATILNVNVRNRFFLLQSNLNLKVVRWKVSCKKVFKVTQTAWNHFLKKALNIASPYYGTAVGAKTTNPKIGQATTNILKSISDGKILSLTDINGRTLR